ncbi:GNAT family N-acetyltransferase [Streptomyces collinus]|uniref:GNAT family N-acetyltransferase n=1 Tax=Streptomyces collinus TaxID=42684 RepID=UPI0037BC600F
MPEVHPTDVQKVRARQWELGIPESFEWVPETTPSLRVAAEESGLVVHEHPLMVLDAGAPAADVDGVSGNTSAGQHQPLAGVSEIVGVGTLPAARRRGLARAVTAALVADARSRGAATVFLSAGDDDVARVYARLGFRRVGTALIAEPAE